MRVLSDVNVPRLTKSDAELFAGILSDLFPGQVATVTARMILLLRSFAPLAAPLFSQGRSPSAV